VLELILRPEPVDPLAAQKLELQPVALNVGEETVWPPVYEPVLVGEILRG
jgi:hypothetical protein